MNSVESAAFVAWPALEEQEIHGWRLRFANGYTKRANSANCTPESIDLSGGQIAEIEHLFRERGLPPIFRLADDGHDSRKFHSRQMAEGFRSRPDGRTPS